MANLKEIRSRITSVSSTMQITSAMKMVSAAKLKKAQDAITAMRPYAEKLTGILQNLSGGSDNSTANKYTVSRPVEKVLIVLITSNRGLCGGFNSNAIKEAVRVKTALYAGKQVDFVTIGKKGHDAISKSNTVVFNNNQIYDTLNFDNTGVIADQIVNLFLDKSYDKIELVYNHFKNAATQIIKTEAFLPIIPTAKTGSAESDYIFEPSKAEIIETLIPKSLKTQLYKAIRDSFASEHGARMTAMHKATDNATELRDQLKLTYNKARQASITNEILEIVGGAEALK